LNLIEHTWCGKFDVASLAKIMQIKVNDENKMNAYNEKNPAVLELK
jgi:hypothetical protein